MIGVVVNCPFFPPEWLKLRSSSQTIRIVSAAIAYEVDNSIVSKYFGACSTASLIFI